MAAKFGWEGPLYRLTTGTRAAWPASGAPSNLSEITTAEDVTLTEDTNELEATDRGFASSGFECVEPGLKKISIEITMKYDLSDTNFVALQTAYEGRTVTAIALMDATTATTGAKGIWADWKVTARKIASPVKDFKRVTFTLKMCVSSVAPAYVTVGA